MQGSKTRLLDKSNKKRDLTPDDFEIMPLMCGHYPRLGTKIIG
jgi:hypothetical protein